MSWSAIIQFFIGLSQYIGLITIFVGGTAIYLYLKGRKDHKREAALLILQEIRYAEQRVRSYRSYGSYSFVEKLLPTNSWHKNINLFVKDLKESELDLISKFFSCAAYLDEVIHFFAEYSNRLVVNPATPAPEDERGVVTKIASADLSEQAKKLIEGVSQSIEYIYNTPAINKLILLSTRKWYHLY